MGNENSQPIDQPTQAPTAVNEEGKASVSASTTTVPKTKGAKPQFDVVFVDDDPEEQRISVGFAPSMFRNNEFKTLKKFCQSRGLHQRHLNKLFKRYLSSEDVFLRDFRVRTLDVKEEIDDMSRLYREVTEIYVPMFYQKDFTGLDKAHSMEEVSFARFVILTYIFLAQPYPDLFFELFCILRQRFNLKTEASMFAYNLEQIVTLLGEELEQTYTYKYLLTLMRELPKDRELTFGNCIKLAIKYPLMFYFIKRFRQHIRRIFLGDKFWNSAKTLKTKLTELGIKKGYEANFKNEHTAKVATTRALLADLYGLPAGKMEINTETFPEVTLIDDSVCQHLKKVIGYRLAKRLILESELPYVKTGQPFLNAPVELGLEDTRFHDSMSGEDLKYNNGTGRRVWICRYTHFEDETKLLKEIDIDKEPAQPDDWGEHNEHEEEEGQQLEQR